MACGPHRWQKSVCRGMMAQWRLLLKALAARRYLPDTPLGSLHYETPNMKSNSSLCRVL